MRVRIASLFIVTILIAPTFHALAEETIVLGDSKQTVLSVLGKPRGKMKKGKSEYWSYQRGVVRITNGKVTYLNIYSKDEAREKESRRRAALEERAKASRKAAEAKRARFQEGAATRDAKLKDEEFISLPPEDQLSFWTGFQSEYPDISVSSIIEPLKAKVQAESEDDEKSDRELLVESIDSKQAELDEWIHKAKTTSAGRTWARKYHLARKRLEEDLVELRKELKTMPEE